LQDFIDLVEPDSLEYNNIRPTDDDEDLSPTSHDSSSLNVTSAQMTLISGVHARLYKHLVHTDWYRPVVMEKLQVADWLKPVLHTYTAACLMTTTLAHVMSEWSLTFKTCTK